MFEEDGCGAILAFLLVILILWLIGGVIWFGVDALFLHPENY